MCDACVRGRVRLCANVDDVVVVCVCRRCVDVGRRVCTAGTVRDAKLHMMFVG